MAREGSARSGAPTGSGRLAPKRLVFVALALILGAFALDRLSMLVWKWRIDRFYGLLSQEVALSWDERAARWRQGAWYTLNVAEPDKKSPKPFPVALTEVVFSRPGGIEPSMVTVDGAGGLHLRYFPPVTAWILRLRAAASDRPFWEELAGQSYSIAVLWYGDRPSSPQDSRPKVVLEHGVPAI